MKENQQDNRWLDEIRNEMQDFEAPLPSGGWGRVSSSLPPEKEPMIGKRWIGAAASVLLCALLGGGYFLFDKVPEAVTEQIEIAEDLQFLDSKISDTPQKELVQQTSYLRNTTKPKKQIKPKITTAKLDPVIEEPWREEDNAIAEYQDAKEAQEQAGTNIPTLNHEEEKVLLAMNDVSGKELEEAGWSFGIHLGGHGSVLDSELAAGTESMGNPSHNANSGINAPVETDDVIETNHHPSWSLGISIGRQIIPKTTLETGLVYTLLTSDVKMRISGIKNQKIQYLGIPVKLNYQMVETQQCQLYASGGIMLERTMSAKRGDERIDIKPWQWSSNLSIGGEFNITNHLSLYIEPGVNWYFNTDASAPSLRSESPVYFNIRGGLRYSY